MDGSIKATAFGPLSEWKIFIAMNELVVEIVFKMKKKNKKKEKGRKH